MVIAVGVDVVDLARFERSLERTPVLRERLFGPEDLSNIGAGSTQGASLAARFAAKEAGIKALGGHIDDFSWHDIQVRKKRTGQPELVVTGGAAKRAQSLGIASWHVSLSHDGPVAVAFVVASASEVSR